MVPGRAERPGVTEVRAGAPRAALRDLQREQVRDGVVATDLASAHAIVQRLLAQVGCPTDTAMPTAASPAPVVTSPTTRPTTAPTPAPITAPAPSPAASAGSCP